MQAYFRIQWKKKKEKEANQVEIKNKNAAFIPIKNMSNNVVCCHYNMTQMNSINKKIHDMTSH